MGPDVAPARIVATNTATVLLVEDEAPVRQVLERQLRAAGHNITAAENGQEGAAILRGGLKPDVLVTDIVMPGTIQGVELAKIAKELVPGIQIVFVSGYPQDAATELSEWPVPTVTLQKPIPKKELLSAIQKSLQSSIPKA